MKRIIICSDGTWNEPDQMDRDRVCPSNVVKIARAIQITNDQPLFYDKGVGTSGWFDKIAGGALGRGLDKNVMDDYEFIVQNYNEGDRIFCFGFSRGAYTVRSLGGLIGKCGILTQINIDKIDDVFKNYRDRDISGESETIKSFKTQYCHSDNTIFFMGVWDTVGALGIPIRGLNRLTAKRYHFHDVRLGAHISNAFQALAIDEQRSPFEPAIWKTENLENQRVEQRWFVGVHSNIGGGYVDTGLSDLTLEWMITKVKECDPELVFDERYIEKNLNPDFRGELRKSRTGYYKLSPPLVRQLFLAENAYETVDDSVSQRYFDMTCDYQPENLQEIEEKLK